MSRRLVSPPRRSVSPPRGVSPPREKLFTEDGQEFIPPPVEVLIEGFRKRAKEARRGNSVLNAYRLEYFEPDGFRGANLNIVFLAHSIEEAILQMNDYLQSDERFPRNLIEDQIEFVYDTAADDIDGYLDAITAFLKSNGTLDITESKIY